MSTEAEQHFLSAVLSPLGDALADLTFDPADCYEPRHEEILQACMVCRQQGRPVDPVTVADQLGDRLSYVGGQAYLHELAALGAVSGSAEHYAHIVATAAMSRRLKQAAAWIEQASDNLEPDEVRDRAMGMLERLSTVDVSIRSIADTLPATLEALEADESDRFVPTGWADLNQLIGGWHPGSVYVVGARPGVGKSVIGAQAALDVGKRGKAVSVASMEMSDDEINMRLLAQQGQVSMSAMHQRKPEPHEWDRISKAVGSLIDLPLFMDSRAHQSVASIRSYARSVSRRRELGLIVIDYLQLMDAPRHMLRASRQEVVADLSRSVKLLARELAVPVLALAQVNRGSEYRQDKRPTMADLRESGAIEADADVVMLLHRESEDDPNLHIGVPKNRHGPLGSVTLTWQGQYARAMDQAWQPSGAIGQAWSQIERGAS